MNAPSLGDSVFTARAHALRPCVPVLQLSSRPQKMAAPVPSTPELLAQLVNAFRQSPPALKLAAGAAPVRAKAPAPGMCHFARLAAVEAQLVLQFLDIPDKLRAARSCKHLQAEAATPFSWKHTAPLFIPLRAGSESDGPNLEANARMQTDRLRGSRLLRHVPTHLALLQTEDEERRNRPVDLPADAVTSFLQLVELDGRSLWRPRLWTELLKSATLTVRLRALHVGQLNPQQMAQVARLPSLQHFCFRLGSSASIAALLPARH